MQSQTFKDRVCAVVAEIPKGEVRTYGEVAQAAGYPRAARAVGMIMSQNHNPNVPCHRVIRSDGRMGGYNGGGIEVKRKKLLAEGWKPTT